MALSQLNCPHCGSMFQVDTSLPSLRVACPHCRQAVALLSEPPVVEPPLEAPPVMDPPLADPPSRDSRGFSPSDLLPPAAIIEPQAAAPRPTEQHEAMADDFRSRQIAVDDRASQKFVKNLIVGVFCAIVLLAILAYFLMRGRA